jgi:cell division protein FtsB
MGKKEKPVEKIINSLKERLKNYLGYLLAFIGLLLILSLVRNILKISESRKKIENERTKVENLKKENEALEKKLAETSGLEFTEKQLRDKLGLAKEGEIVVVLPDEKILEGLVPKVPEEEETLPDPIWKRWLKLFL